MARLCNRVVLTLAVFLVAQFSAAQSLDLHLESLVTIGDGDDVGAEYLFDFPTHVVADDLGNVYVAERRSMEIRMFRPDGKYVRTLGTSGRGPGEFTHISAMTTNHDNELVIFDKRTGRVTRYGADGTMLETKKLDLNAGIWDSIQLSDGSYVVNYFRHESLYGDRKPEQHVLHVMEPDFTATRKSFVSTSDMYEAYADVPLVSKFWYSRETLVYAADGEDNLYVAPLYYDGTIYRYLAEENYAQRHVFSTRDIGGPAALDLDKRKRDGATGVGLGWTCVFHVTKGEHCITILRSSRGMAKLPNGSWLHFYDDSERQPHLMAELIGADGALLGTTSVQLSDSPDDIVSFRLHWDADGGVIYAVDSAPGYPVIRKYRVSYEFK